jgi:hypothetical protein
LSFPLLAYSFPQDRERSCLTSFEEDIKDWCDCIALIDL